MEEGHRRGPHPEGRNMETKGYMNEGGYREDNRAQSQESTDMEESKDRCIGTKKRYTQGTNGYGARQDTENQQGHASERAPSGASLQHPSPSFSCPC